MRFRTLLFFISAAAVTIPCLVMGWLQYVAVEREFTEDDRTRAEISLLVSERLEAKVDNAVSLVTAAAEILKSEEGEPAEKLNLILEELCKASPDILNMHFDDPSAVSVAFLLEKTSAVNLISAFHIKIALTGRILMLRTAYRFLDSFKRSELPTVRL